MDFFKRQQEARQRTGLLVAYFIAAVIAITVSVNLVVAIVAGSGGFFASGLSVVAQSQLRFGMDGSAWIWTTVATLVVIAVGTLFSYVRLAEGGRAVARMMDARPVDLNSSDPRIRRLVNVVEEMAIASGTPVPDLYIQEGEAGINAYVAGYEIREAVMVVTEGALAELNREELQGVIGHEFSHILNGDMRINVRLIAILAGITLLSQIGGYLMRTRRLGRYPGYVGRGYASARSGRHWFAMGGVGLALFGMGYLGLMFGRLIKAAISREREYLADASSVQFTRNPFGVAFLSHPHAEDMSHMCFGDTMRYRFAALYATHPPIDDRINAIAPDFQPAAVHAEADSSAVAAYHAESPTGTTAGSDPNTVFGAVINAQILLDSVGNPNAEHMELACEIRSGFSAELLDQVHESTGARGIVYALILAAGAPRLNGVTVDDKARETILKADGVETIKVVDGVLDEVSALDEACRFALLELAFPALGRLHYDQKDALLGTLSALIRSDDQFSLYEFALQSMIRRQLQSSVESRPDSYRSFQDVVPHLKTLISLFAHLGSADSAGGEQLYARVMRTFSIDHGDGPLPAASPRQLTECLDHLDRLVPMLKRPVINACADCILNDQQVGDRELQLLRATCASLDCPVPPLNHHQVERC